MGVIPLRKQEEEEEVTIEPGAVVTVQRAEARGRASSVPKLLFPAQRLPLPGDVASWVTEALAAPRRWVDGLSSAPVATRQPDHLAQLWTRHREAAQQWNGALPKGCRYVWGVVHVAVYAICLVVLAVAYSPPMFFLAVALAAACWFGL